MDRGESLDGRPAMSPVGGVGINYAIQDAVATVNVLSQGLKSGRVSDADLAEVQRQREWPTRVIQAAQSFLQRRIIAGALNTAQAANVPWQLRLFAKIPIVRDIPPKISDISST